MANLIDVLNLTPEQVGALTAYYTQVREGEAVAKQPTVALAGGDTLPVYAVKAYREALAKGKTNHKAANAGTRLYFTNVLKREGNWYDTDDNDDPVYPDMIALRDALKAIDKPDIKADVQKTPPTRRDTQASARTVAKNGKAGHVIHMPDGGFPIDKFTSNGKAMCTCGGFRSSDVNEPCHNVSRGCEYAVPKGESFTVVRSDAHEQPRVQTVNIPVSITQDDVDGALANTWSDSDAQALKRAMALLIQAGFSVEPVRKPASLILSMDSYDNFVLTDEEKRWIANSPFDLVIEG